MKICRANTKSFDLWSIEGIGRKAMELVLNEIKSKDYVKSITICFMPTNPVAKKFYDSFGFKEVGVNSDGEIVAEITN